MWIVTSDWCVVRESVIAEANGKEPIYDHQLMKPYVFFDVSTGRESRQGTGSLRNQVTLLTLSITNCLLTAVY